MPRYRGLSLKTFIHAVPWNLFEQYFDHLPPSDRPSPWVYINVEAMERFLADPEHAQASAIVREDFSRINDIAAAATGILVRAYQKYEIAFDQNQPRQELAMRLFLDHHDAFEFAWSRFLLFSSTSRLSIYRIPVDVLPITASGLRSFESGVRRWFVEQAKGEHCNVRPYEDYGESVLLVQRGTYVRAVPFWEGDRIGIQSFRPAVEDVLVYEPDTCLLRIKASLPKDRNEYLRLFAACIAGDESLAAAAAAEEIFTLGPLQDGSFDFGGAGPIIRIEPVKVGMRVYGVSNTVLEIKANDIRQAFEYDLAGLTMDAGLLTWAKFRCHLQIPGQRPKQITFVIEPPSRTDLTDKPNAGVIFSYLERQGVKLR